MKKVQAPKLNGAQAKPRATVANNSGTARWLRSQWLANYMGTKAAIDSASMPSSCSVGLM